MTDIEATNIRVIQSYGGYKEIYFEAEGVTAADVITFPSTVSGIKMANIQDSDDGAAVKYTITGTGDITLTIGTGPSSDDLIGRLLFRSY